MQQRVFLQNVHRLLTPDGVLVMDVFGRGIGQTKTPGRTGLREDVPGFWSAVPCYLLSECQHVEAEHVWGQKYVVIPDHGEVSTYVMWDHYFTVDSLTALLNGAGFAVEAIEPDLVPDSDFTSADVLFVRARKQPSINDGRPWRPCAIEALQTKKGFRWNSTTVHACAARSP